jgi:CRISPR-associated endoribonuclease Cas6
MPTLIEMRLKAAWAVRLDTRTLHGLACALFEGDAIPVGEHTGQDKPWAVSPLRPWPDGTADEWLWRAAWHPDSPVPAAAQTADTLRVGHTSCVVTESTQRRVSHAALAAGPVAREVTMTFGSPTFFSRNGTDLVLPDPRLIADSWQRRWNASLPDEDPLRIHEDTWKEARRLMELASFDLRTEPRDSGHGRSGTGFVGTAVLRAARGAPATVRGFLGTLARFAEYSGTGAQTTHGFGATNLTAIW